MEGNPDKRASTEDFDKINVPENSVEYSLRQLEKWLRYGKFAWIVVFTSIFIPFNTVITLLWIVAILFTPFLLWYLYMAEWKRALRMFAGVVAFPFFLFLLIRTDYPTLDLLLRIIPLALFFIYIGVLHRTIIEKLTEIKMEKHKEFQQKIGGVFEENHLFDEPGSNE